MRLEFQDSIDRYLLNKMSEEERTLFETRCSENPELKEQFEHTRDVKTAITERNKILARIRELDNEYAVERRLVAKRKKKAIIYWMSGIAAVFAIGYFLMPAVTHHVDLKDLENQTQKFRNDRDIAKVEAVKDSMGESDKSDRLIAKNDAELERKSVEIISPSQGQTLTFGNNDIQFSNQTTMEVLANKLEVVEYKLKVLADEIEQIDLQYNIGLVSTNSYNIKSDSLNRLSDKLYWEKSCLLLELDRKEEAERILDKLRKGDGHYQSRADSLYNNLF